MYLGHFGLTEQPFELRTDPRFLFLSPAHTRARAYLQYAVLKRDSIVVISGDIGSGKSTLIEDVCRQTDPNYELVVLHQTQLDDLELLRAVQLGLGVRTADAGKARTLDRIRGALIDLHERGRKTILIVDDAQNLSATAIEELRMLADDECDGERLLSLVLVGQIGLNDVLDGDTLAQVRQRVRLSYHLEPLDEVDVGRYIDHRLRIAGNRRDGLFRSDAVAMIFRLTGGVPRLINIVCDMALTSAALDESTIITAEVVDAAATELDWSDPAASPEAWTRVRAWLRARWQGATETGKRWTAALRRSHTTARQWPSMNGVWQWVFRQKRALHQTRVAFARWAGDRRDIVASKLIEFHRRGSVYTKRRGLDRYAAVYGKPAAFAMVAVALLSVALFARDRPRTEITADASPAAAFEPSDVQLVLASYGDSRNSEGLVGPPAPFVASVKVSPALTPDLDTTPLLAVPVVKTLPSGAPVRDAQWIMAQEQDAYAIQIMGTHSPANLNRFLTRYEFDSRLARYTVQRNGQDWIVIVTGVYPNFRTARTAAASLPAAVRSNEPWVRRFGEIQSDIRLSRARRLAMESHGAVSETAGRD